MKRSEDDKKIISNELKELKINQDEIKSLLKEKENIKKKIADYRAGTDNKHTERDKALKSHLKVILILLNDSLFLNYCIDFLFHYIPEFIYLL